MGFSSQSKLDHKTEMALRSFEYRENFRKYGCNEDLDLNIREDVWDQGGNYIFTAGIIGQAGVPYYVSSSSALDTQRIQHAGIDEKGYKQRFFQNLQGQTKVRLGDENTLWFRYYRGVNRDNVNQLQLAGTVYIYEDTTVVAGVPTDLSKVRAVIKAGKDQTQMAIYTVAINEIESFENIKFDLINNTATAVSFEIYARVAGEVWTLQKTTALNSLGTGVVQEEANPPLTFFPGTDIVVKATPSSNNIGVCAEWNTTIRKIS